MIELVKISKKFNNVVALNIPSLIINKGEVVSFVGNNGAGKTTTFRLILDLIKADAGYVNINGIDVSRNDEWKLISGSFIDSNFLIDFFTPEEYFKFIGKLHKIKNEEIKNRLLIYDKFMNGEILNQKKYIRYFSSGNKQKIGIIAAMMINPEILILDEPFNYLDPSSQIEMKRLLKWHNDENNTTILLSSHNINYANDVSNRIILLEKGIIITDSIINNNESISDILDYFNK